VCAQAGRQAVRIPKAVAKKRDLRHFSRVVRWVATRSRIRFKTLKPWQQKCLAAAQNFYLHHHFDLLNI